MQKAKPAASPDAYVAALDGWRHECVAALRATVRASAALEEVVKWGHLVYLANGPVLLIRAEESRVLFGFWRGSACVTIERRLRPGGKYEMATLELREGMTVDCATVRRLTREAVALNEPARRSDAGSEAAVRAAHAGCDDRAMPAIPSRYSAAENQMDSKVRSVAICAGILGVQFAIAQEPAAPKPGPSTSGSDTSWATGASKAR